MVEEIVGAFSSLGNFCGKLLFLPRMASMSSPPKVTLTGGRTLAKRQQQKLRTSHQVLWFDGSRAGVDADCGGLGVDLVSLRLVSK